jgi:hypothetical protein
VIWDEEMIFIRFSSDSEPDVNGEKNDDDDDITTMMMMRVD